MARPARYLIPKFSLLLLDLDRYLNYSTPTGPHGSLDEGRTLDEVLGEVKMWSR